MIPVGDTLAKANCRLFLTAPDLSVGLNATDPPKMFTLISFYTSLNVNGNT